MSGVSNEHTDGALMLTLILLGDGSITCHDITVSFKHTSGAVSLPLSMCWVAAVLPAKHEWG